MIQRKYVLPSFGLQLKHIAVDKNLPVVTVCGIKIEEHKVIAKGHRTKGVVCPKCSQQAVKSGL